MKPTLQLKQSQQLTLTPQLQQAIRLLQLSTLEVNQEVERLLDENLSLNANLENAFENAYGDAVLIAAGELDRDKNIFPSACSFRL